MLEQQLPQEPQEPLRPLPQEEALAWQAQEALASGGFGLAGSTLCGDGLLLLFTDINHLVVVLLWLRLHRRRRRLLAFASGHSLAAAGGGGGTAAVGAGPRERVLLRPSTFSTAAALLSFCC